MHNRLYKSAPRGSGQNRGSPGGRNSMRKLLAFASALALSAGISGAAFAQEVGVVVKIGGIPWFTAMEEGIKKKSEELGITGEMIGPV